MNEDKIEVYILDTSALLTYIEDEEGSELVDDILIKAENNGAIIYISFVSMTEVFYITIQERDEEEALRRIELIKSLEIKIEESNEDLNLKAGRLKATYNISLADAYIATLCQLHEGVLVHKDPEFEELSSLIREYKLPYKTSSKK